MTGDAAAVRRWGPDRWADAPVVLLTPVRPWSRASLLALTRRLEEASDVPVQAVRADRVLGAAHLTMAVHHALRAAETGHGRAQTPAMEALLYLAGDRQIHRALGNVGLPLDDGAEPVAAALFGVGPGAELSTASAGVDLVVETHRFDASTTWPYAAAALSHWRRVHALPDDAHERIVERRLLAAMAALAVDKP